MLGGKWAIEIQGLLCTDGGDQMIPVLCGTLQSLDEL